MTESEKSIESKMEVMDADQETRQRALVSKGMGLAEACVESRKQTWDKYGDRMAGAIGDVLDQFIGDTDAIKEMIKADPGRAADRLSRIRQRAAQTLETVEKWKNLLSTHPSLESKGLFIGKVDARQVQVSPEQARERFAKFKPVESETSTSQVVIDQESAAQ